MYHSQKSPAHGSKTELLTVMDFHGSNVAVEKINGNLMFNATQMAKPFGKRTRDWLITQQAKDLLKALTEAGNLASAELQVVRKGGKNQGTFFHEEVALLFAQWLSPEFYIACNRKLKELLSKQALNIPERHGVAGTILDGAVMYAYMDAMREFGNTNTGAWKRKQKHPTHFKKQFGRNFVTGKYLDTMKSYYIWKNGANQLKLEL